MKKTAFLLLLSLFVSGFATAQNIQNDVVASGGGQATAGNLDLEYTIGEPVIETVGNATLTVTQGFHQTSLIITFIEDLSLNVNVRVFPNPAQSTLIVDMPVNLDYDFTCTLYNMQGEKLFSELITPGKNTISMQAYSNGNYVLMVKNRTNGKYTTYKITKNK